MIALQLVRKIGGFKANFNLLGCSSNMINKYNQQISNLLGHNVMI